MTLLIDTVTMQIVAQTTDSYLFDRGDYIAIDEPEGFTNENAADWYWNGEELINLPGFGLYQAKLNRCRRIKKEAAERLNDLAWRLERAREREALGDGSLRDVAEALAERETVRLSSNAAENTVMGLTTIEDVESFVWKLDVVKAPPQLLSSNDFALRFKDEELANICSAAAHFPAIAAWLERFRAAKTINLDDPALIAGVQALEMAGLITAGRAEQICQTL